MSQADSGFITPETEPAHQASGLSRRSLLKGTAVAAPLVTVLLRAVGAEAQIASEAELLDRYLAWLDAEACWLQWALYPQLRGRYVPSDYIVRQHFDDEAVRWSASQRAIPILRAAGVSLAPDAASTDSIIGRRRS